VSLPYSKRLATKAYGVNTVDAVVPAGKVWVITCVTAVGRPAAAGNLTFATIGDPGLVFAAFLTPAGGAPVPPWVGRLVLAAGETLSLGQSNQPFDMTASGFELAA
jgi:hypothetical protein